MGDNSHLKNDFIDRYKKHLKKKEDEKIQRARDKGDDALAEAYSGGATKLINFLEDAVDEFLTKQELMERTYLREATIEAKVEYNEVLYLQTPDDTAFIGNQIKGERILDGVAILNNIHECLGRLSGLSRLQFYLNPCEHLGGLTPLEYLKQNGYDEKIRTAAHNIWRHTAN